MYNQVLQESINFERNIFHMCSHDSHPNSNFSSPSRNDSVTQQVTRSSLDITTVIILNRKRNCHIIELKCEPGIHSGGVASTLTFISFYITLKISKKQPLKSQIISLSKHLLCKEREPVQKSLNYTEHLV